MAKDWLKNQKGENNYLFNWMDEHGFQTGFNDVWASNMKEARQRAKLRETKAHWSIWDVKLGKYITIPNEIIGDEHCFRMRGMYIDPKSFRRATYKTSREMDRIAVMMTC
jgi:hypothetical protein